jgi:hypothetical protein
MGIKTARRSIGPDYYNVGDYSRKEEQKEEKKEGQSAFSRAVLRPRLKAGRS